MGNQRKNITLRLAGSRTDQGQVRLNDFARLCDMLLRSLRSIEHDITHENPRAVFRIVELEAKSAAIGLVPAPSENERDVGLEVAEVWKGTVRALEIGEPIDERVSFGSLERLREMHKPIWRRRGDGHLLLVDGVALTDHFARRIEQFLHTPIKSSGTVSGLLAKLNVLNRNEFTLFPPVGKFHVVCHFDDSLIEKVRNSVKRHVTVKGTLYYREAQPYPVRADVNSITIHPENSELPRLSELRGIAPNAANGMESVAAVRALRDG